ncbi:MAG: LapA family protein [Gammaproteobacteria bacterium]|nr:LapA family protein [Gammaproteobacteria bacterium]MBU1646739.1 LapA family protein [Gammaproteobacteria bacterium]MBU1971773.1 LapA family protein [Gammaproteobacteria bacterium]
MSLVVWLLRAVIFFMLFGLAIKNSGTVELRFFLDQAWQAPLSLVLLVAFTAGVVIGLAAVVSTWTRQRRELSKLQRQLAKAAKDSAAEA